TMPMPHSAASMLCLWLEHRRCALWLGLLELVSNGRIGKNGGAVLTAHINECDFSRTSICHVEAKPKHLVVASERRERGNQQAKNPNNAG
ncbi:MAG: hypothetical protein K2N70_02625, partial [Helicobacter sp.]|nr:hypothetical protein [Helicobacter sp.]